MTDQPENPRAFPSSATDDKYGGMTLRDWFAGQALSSPAADYHLSTLAARAAYELADAMLAERGRQK